MEHRSGPKANAALSRRLLLANLGGLAGLGLLTALAGCGAGAAATTTGSGSATQQATTTGSASQVSTAPTAVPATTSAANTATSAVGSAASSVATSATPTASAAAASGAGTTIELGSYFNSGPRLDFMKTVIDRFQQANPAVTVRFDPVPSAQYWTTMQVRLAGNTAPDVLIGSGATFIEFAENGGWKAVDSYLQTDKFSLDDYYQQPKIFTWQGKQYGLPFMENVTIFVYNKTMFQTAGVPAPSDAWTWTDMLDAAKKLTKPGQFGLIIPDGFEFAWWTFLWSHGGDSISPDFKKTTLSDPKSVEAFQWLVDLKLVQQVSPKEGDTSLGDGDPFTNNKVAMTAAGTGSLGNWLTSIQHFEWDLFYPPADPTTNKRIVSSNGNPYLMTKDTKHPDQAWLMLKHLAGVPTQQLIAQTKIAMPTLISVATDANGFMKAPPASMKYTDMDMKVSHDDEFHKFWSDWYSEITKQMLPAFKGEKTVQDAAKAADQAGDVILQKE